MLSKWMTTLKLELIHKSFDMELAKDKASSNPIVAEVPYILVHFAFWIFLRRRVRGSIFDFDESFIEYELI